MKNLNIGIVGGSIAGCSAAILLSHTGHQVSVFERSKGALVGRGGGIGTLSAVIKSLIEEDFLDPDFPNWATSEMPFTIRTAAEERLGYTPWAMSMDLRVFHWSALWNNLRKRVPDETYHQGHRVVSAIPDSTGPVLLRFDDGSEREFDLILFADGYNSFGRQLIQPGSELVYRGYRLWRGLLPEREIENSNLLGRRLPRLAYPDLPGNMVAYFIPDDHGSTQEGDRICNWAAYLPMDRAELSEFMIDRNGVLRSGTIPPGKMRIEEEDRLKQLMADNLPTYFGEIVSKTQETYVQLIYTVDLSTYNRDRMCLIGDAGMVVQPFTGSGVFKGYHNATDLLQALESHDTIEEALAGWSEIQVRTGKRLLALGEQMEKAFIWEPLDFANADAETTAAWWKASVTFPEEFSYESDSR